MSPKNNFIEYTLGYSSSIKVERNRQVKTLTEALLSEGPLLVPVNLGYVRRTGSRNIYKVSDGMVTPFGKVVKGLDPQAEIYAATCGKNHTRKFAVLNYSGNTYVIYQVDVYVSSTISIVNTSDMKLYKVNHQGAIEAHIKICMASMEHLPLLINDEAVNKNPALKKLLYKRLGYTK